MFSLHITIMRFETMIMWTENVYERMRSGFERSFEFWKNTWKEHQSE